MLTGLSLSNMSLSNTIYPNRAVAKEIPCYF